MLRHSSRWEDLGARLVLADARHSELPSKAFGLLVSSLGDPYNVDDFWFEARRILDVEGVCLFTTPAPEWAEWFRPASQRADAEFVLSDGSTINVPSYVPSAEEQVSMIERAGFEVQEVQSYFARDIAGPVSPKLVPPGRLQGSFPVLRGFSALRLP